MSPVLQSLSTSYHIHIQPSEHPWMACGEIYVSHATMTKGSIPYTKTVPPREFSEIMGFSRMFSSTRGPHRTTPQCRCVQRLDTTGAQQQRILIHHRSFQQQQTKVQNFQSFFEKKKTVRSNALEKPFVNVFDFYKLLA